MYVSPAAYSLSGLSTASKQFRAVATRYDKLKNRYEATITIASIMIWLRAKPDRSRP
jgi:transposase